jgi:hypothetical protein
MLPPVSRSHRDDRLVSPASRSTSTSVPLETGGFDVPDDIATVVQNRARQKAIAKLAAFVGFLSVPMAVVGSVVGAMVTGSPFLGAVPAMLVLFASVRASRTSKKRIEALDALLDAEEDRILAANRADAELRRSDIVRRGIGHDRAE